MKGYCTKYALTKGIREVTVYFSANRDKSTKPGYEKLPKFVYDRPPHRIGVQLKPGVNFFFTREEAEVEQRKMAKKKISSLQKQIDKLEQLTAE